MFLSLTSKSFYVGMNREVGQAFNDVDFNTLTKDMDELSDRFSGGYVYDLEYDNMSGYGLWFTVRGDTESEIDELAKCVLMYLKSFESEYYGSRGGK